MSRMQAIIKICDKITEKVGHTFAWLAIPIACLVFYEVISRRVFNDPHMWALDVCTLIYAVHFMMVGPYGLLKGAHVNIDTIYVLMSKRMQASFDLASYILFFIPYFIVFIIAGYDLAFESIEMGERTVTGTQFIVPIEKILIPLSAFFMLIAGISQVLRCLHILISGKEVEI